VVFRRIAEYEDRGLIRAWLFTISRQIASHYHRGNTRAETRRQGFAIDLTSVDLNDTLARRAAERREAPACRALVSGRAGGAPADGVLPWRT
jgi:DNA-directed RNA polymerase specialized sigma24 family protein